MLSLVQFSELRLCGAGDGNRTRMASLEGWTVLRLQKPESTGQDTVIDRHFLWARGLGIPWAATLKFSI